MNDQPRLTDYLGRREGPKLEFKSAECLKDLRDISREVCGFLNTEGGEIIIGIREEASGLALSPVPEPEKARKSLRDYLISTIEPTPDIDPKILESPHGSGIRVSVPKGRILHVTREKQGTFAAYRRVGDRLVAMAWHEILERLSREKTRGRPEVEDGKIRTLKLLEEWQTAASERSTPLRKHGGIFLFLRPNKALNLSNDAWQRIQGWIEDPTLLGIRRMGWHYSKHSAGLSLVQGDPGWRGNGDPATGFRWIELSGAGELRFATRLGEDIFWIQKHDDVKSLYPYALCETIASCATLFAKVIEDASPGGEVWAAVGLTGIHGISLGPYKPNAFGYENRSSWREPYLTDSLPSLVSSARKSEFIKNPHPLAWRLVSQVYECFGYTEEAVPFYSPETARFAFE